MKKIIFTGGGSGGHVIPAQTIIQEIQSRNIEIDLYYIGGRKSIEREIIRKVNIKYFPIFTGKLRRYFSIENFIDFFRFIVGVIQSILILMKLRKNSLVFSTGGFVALPVVIAAKLLGIKSIIHEQTAVAGLANKISSKFCDQVLISFEKSAVNFPPSKTILTGYPVTRKCFDEPRFPIEVKEGSSINSKGERKILLITGGGNGSKLINDVIKESLHELKKSYKVFHQVGSLYESEFKELEDDNYVPFSFANSLVDLIKISDVIVSRAGAGTVMELISIGKKSIFVPLKIAQKNEQFHNASEAKDVLGSEIILEDDFNAQSLLSSLNKFESSSEKMLDNKASDKIIKIILDKMKA